MASGLLLDYMGTGPIASRPASPTLHTGTLGLWYADDTGVLSAWDGSVWADVSGAVSSVNGQTGIVVLDATDLDYDNSGSGLAATDVQAAIDELAAGSGGGADRSTVSALSASGSVAVDYALGDYFTLALAGNVSGFTFSNLPGVGHGATLMIRITQDSTARTVAWPGSFKWAGGSAGAVSTGSGAVDILAITTFDNGTTWDATLAKAFA